LAKDRIEKEDRQGNVECEYATARSAGFIRQAIQMDKRDRQRRLMKWAPTIPSNRSASLIWREVQAEGSKEEFEKAFKKVAKEKPKGRAANP